VGIATCWERISETIPCVMDRKGEVTGVTENSSIFKDVTTQELFEIKNVKLVVGTILQFKGTKVVCKTDPCYNIVECYKVISAPPVPCVKDKKGVVIAGKDVFAGRLFIQEMSPISSYIPIYAIQENNASDSKPLKIGDQVKFGGYLQKNDSAAAAIYPLKIVGVATCWEVIPNTACVMNRKGVITSWTNNASIVKDIETGQIFAINGVKLAVNTTVIFKGVLIQCITTPCYNNVECYQIVSTPPPPCVMDKKGVVVEGIGDCKDQLFIEEYSMAAIAIKQLYSFKNNAVIADGPVSSMLKVGDKVMFGGYLIKNDSNYVRLCNIIGVATCWKSISDTVSCVKDRKGVVIELTENGSLVKDYSKGEIFAINGVKLAIGTTILFKGVKIECVTTPCYNIVECYQIINIPPPPCVMDKVGVVVPGIDGCTGRLFIQETTNSNSYPQLYAIQNYIATSSDGATITKLKPGDKVKFGGYLTKNDSTKSILCYTVGVATCYEIIANQSTYTFAGKAMVGKELMKSGLAVLFKKGEGKAMASNTIADGTFTFSNLPEADYTVYIIPDINIYKDYLPTFYINKFLFQQADYIRLNKDIIEVVVYLRNLNMEVGSGKIYGNIHFETDQLKDSILAANGKYKLFENPNRVAENAAIVLFDNSNQPLAWTISDVDGNYLFENLSLNTYRVVSETASAKAEMKVDLTTSNTEANADLILKSSEEKTAISRIENNVLDFYPNPVEDKLIINVKENEQLNIYSAVGQLLLNQYLNSGVNILDVSTINKGIYFAKIGNSTIRMIKK